MFSNIWIVDAADFRFKFKDGSTSLQKIPEIWKHFNVTKVVGFEKEVELLF